MYSFIHFCRLYELQYEPETQTQRQTLSNSLRYFYHILLLTSSNFRRRYDLLQIVHWCFGVEWHCAMCDRNASLLNLTLSQCGHSTGVWICVNLCLRNMIWFFNHFPQTSHCFFDSSLSRWVIAWCANFEGAENPVPQTSQINVFLKIGFLFSCITNMCDFKLLRVTLFRRWIQMNGNYWIIFVVLFLNNSNNKKCYLLFIANWTLYFYVTNVKIFIIVFSSFVVFQMISQYNFAWKFFTT